jgi:S1-C subfamily serine protease
LKNLQEATERICELKGNIVALDAACSALVQQLPARSREHFRRAYEGLAEMARTSMLNMAISEHSIAAFEFDVARIVALVETLQRQEGQAVAPAPPPQPAPPARGRDVVESLLLAVRRVSTFEGARALTGASGFFFERDERLYLVTSRHVLVDEPSRHFPDRLEIVVHTDEADLSRTSVFSLLLYRHGRAVWRQGRDSGGEVDVAVLRIERDLLAGFRPHAFSPRHLQQPLGDVEIGTPLLVVGFPLGFQDGRHQLPVARQAAVASSFGTRFQGQGMFLTDARTHRGTSGAPVVMRAGAAARHDLGPLPWKLLGIHASRMDMGGRDLVADESLGLNCAWYADILLALTED